MAEAAVLHCAVGQFALLEASGSGNGATLTVGLETQLTLAPIRKVTGLGDDHRRSDLRNAPKLGAIVSYAG